jgi:hypothetical protein
MADKEGDMDRELADAFKEQRESTQLGFTRLEAKFDDLRSDMNSHFVSDAAGFQKVTDSATSCHKRIDDHQEDHKAEKGHRTGLWIGIALAIVGALASAVLSFAFTRKP